MTCVCQKLTIWCPNKNLMCKASQKKNRKYRGSIYALSMFIRYPNYTYTNPNVSLGLIFGGVIFGKMFDLVYRGANIREGLYSGFYSISLDLHN